MNFIVGVPKVNIEWVKVEADDIETALANANDDESCEELDESVYSHTLEMDEFKVRLPNGEEVSSEEAIDLEGAGERIGE